MKLENFLNKDITVTQIKGGSKLTDKVKGNLIGLGLRGIGTSSKLKATNAVLGMIRKVSHVVSVAANS